MTISIYASPSRIELILENSQCYPLRTGAPWCINTRKGCGINKSNDVEQIIAASPSRVELILENG
jgi:hypothetical protein